MHGMPVLGRNQLPRAGTSRKNRVRITLLLAVVAVPAFLLGLAVAKFIPIAGGTDFWNDFFIGPPAAGLFALAAAGVAFLSARTGTKAVRETALKNTETLLENARRQEWWNRAEWALNLATSDNTSNRAVGIETLRLMLLDAEPQEAAMVKKVIDDVASGVYKSSAKPVETSDNGGEGGDAQWVRNGQVSLMPGLQKAKQILSRTMRKKQRSGSTKHTTSSSDRQT